VLVAARLASSDDLARPTAGDSPARTMSQCCGDRMPPSAHSSVSNELTGDLHELGMGSGQPRADRSSASVEVLDIHGSLQH
jgi:hypothetical protein